MTMMKTDKVNEFGNEKIWKLFFKYSLPSIAGMMVFASYNVVDRIFVGRGVGTLAISGITVTFPMLIVYMAFGLCVGMGATALISIKLGEKKVHEAEKVFGNALILSAIISVILISLSYIYLDYILILLGGSGQVLVYARDYTRVLLIGAIFQQIAFSMNGVIRADGSPKIAMISMLLSSVMNIILNPIFIFGLHWGIRGSAWATVFSQSISFIWVIAYFRGNKSYMKIRFKNFRLNYKIIAGIFSIGVSPFIMQISGSIVNILFNQGVARYGGDIGLAVIGIGNTIIMFLFMPIFGINQGIQPIIGYNYGAQQFGRVREILWIGIIGATIISFLGFVAIMFFSDSILAVFSKNDLRLVNLGSHGLKILMMMLPIIGFPIIISNFFLSIGKARSSMILSLSRQVMLLIPLLIILPRFFALEGIWMSEPIADFISAIIASVLIFKEIKLLKVVPAEIV